MNLLLRVFVTTKHSRPVDLPTKHRTFLYPLTFPGKEKVQIYAKVHPLV